MLNFRYIGSMEQASQIKGPDGPLTDQLIKFGKFFSRWDGPDRPEYEPRGCPRGAAFSWYTYSPTRVKYPYIRGPLLEMYREAKAIHSDPVDAFHSIVSDPAKRSRYVNARGKGGLVRSTWAEALELMAAAHVHTIKYYGPDRNTGFTPIPAMSMVSFSAGVRYIQLMGGVMTSFYDWYADLPVASPQVFGDQTDVPESGDWWDAAYLIMWGANVPLTFEDFSLTYTDLPFLVTLETREDGVKVPSKFLTAAKLAGEAEQANSDFKPVMMDRETGEVFVPNGTMGHRYAAEDQGKWNLDLQGRKPILSIRDLPQGESAAVEIKMPTFDDPKGHGDVITRGVPVAYVEGHEVTTVFDIMLAQYGVGRKGLPGTWAKDYDDWSVQNTPAWQEPITSVPAEAVIRIAREFAKSALDSGGRSMVIFGAGICQWYHADTTYRAILALLNLTGCQGRNGGGWAHYVGQEKARPLTGLTHTPPTTCSPRWLRASCATFTPLTSWHAPPAWAGCRSTRSSPRTRWTWLTRQSRQWHVARHPRTQTTLLSA